MATADNVYLPEEVERGAIISWVVSTQKNEGDDGSDDRYNRFPFPKMQAVISYGPEYVEAVETLFWTQHGPRRSFLFRPPLPRHYTAERQQMLGGELANGTDVIVQLEINKISYDEDDQEVRRVTKPILHPRADMVQIWVDGAALDGADFTVGALGIVTLDSAPAYGAVIEASFEYDTAMRFVADDLDVALPDSHREGDGSMTYIEQIKQVTLEEVFNE